MIATASASDPCISVVIPCYERINFLRNALYSVFSQTLKPSEILVVDDGSPTPIEHTLGREFPGVHWLHQENSVLQRREISELKWPNVLGLHS